MKINLMRKTGFFGMGSSLKVIKNGEVIGNLTHDESQTIEVTEGQAELMVKLSFLKSDVYSLVNDQKDKNIAVKINPSILKLYISLFTLVFILPILFKSWLLGLGIVAAYFIFVAVMARKFYVLEEIE